MPELASVKYEQADVGVDMFRGSSVACAQSAVRDDTQCFQARDFRRVACPACFLEAQVRHELMVMQAGSGAA